MNEEQYIEIWLMFKGYLDKQYPDIAAEHFIDLIMDHHNDVELLSEMKGVDMHLDTAIENYVDRVEEIELDEEEM